MDFYWVPILLWLARLQDPPDDQLSEKSDWTVSYPSKVSSHWHEMRFRTTQNAVIRLIPNFCLDRPFRVFNPPGYPFLPNLPFSGFQLIGCTVFSFLIPHFCPNLFHFLGSSGCLFLPGLFFLLSSRSISCEVFFNCVWVHRGSEVFTIHRCKH